MRNRKILIVDDDPDIREGMHVRLKYNGYDTCFATDAASCILAAGDEEPDLIILDLGLPAGDGFLAMEHLKAHPKLGLIPIIVVSARDARANQERATHAGAKAYLQKPVDNAEFLAVIREALARIASEEEPGSRQSGSSGVTLPKPHSVAGKAAATDDSDTEARLLRKLTRIRKDFLLRTRGELPLLDEMLGRIQAGDSTGLAQLHGFAHRIHGSGATFDFAAISESAGEVEKLITVLIGTSTATVVEPHGLDNLVQCGRRLALEIGAATTQGLGVSR
jgi:DNA-binding response OmpR family regulator